MSQKKPAAPERTPEENAEYAAVAKLSDAEVLKRTGHGQFGPAIIGKALHERSASLLKGTDGGKFGPAITDPDYAKKQAALRHAEKVTAAATAEDGDDADDETANKETGDIDPRNLKDNRNPWSYVTLSGAKVLAQKNNVSYKPGIKRPVLIDLLIDAKVVPPAIEADEEKGKDSDPDSQE